MERTQAVVADVERIAPARRPGVAHTVTNAGMSFLLQANSPNFASMFIVLDPFEERQTPDLRRHGDHGEARGSAGPRRCRTRRSRCSGRRRSRGSGRPAGSSSSSRTAAGSACAPSTPDGRPRREAQGAAGLNSAATQFRPRIPQLHLDIDRTKAASLGVSPRRREPDARHVPRVAVREQLQRVRPALAGDHPGRRRVPQPGREHQPVPGAEQGRADGPAEHAGQRPGGRRADLGDAVQPVHAGPDQRQRAARASATATRSGHQRRRRRDAAAVHAASSGPS